MRKYLPPLILFFLLLIGWQALALGINAAYILPTPIQVIQKLWELREPLFMVHLPATMSVTFIGLGISVVLGLALAIAMDMQTYADTAGWCRCLRPDCLIIRSGYVDCRDCRYYRKNCDPMAKRTVNTMIEHL